MTQSGPRSFSRSTNKEQLSNLELQAGSVYSSDAPKNLQCAGCDPSTVSWRYSPILCWPPAVSNHLSVQRNTSVTLHTIEGESRRSISTRHKGPDLYQCILNNLHMLPPYLLVAFFYMLAKTLSQVLAKKAVNSDFVDLYKAPQ